MGFAAETRSISIPKGILERRLSDISRQLIALNNGTNARTLVRVIYA